MATSLKVLHTLCFIGFVFLLVGEGNLKSVQAHVLKRSVPLFDEFKRLTFSGLSTADNSKWELAHVKFLTPARHRRDLTERKFHIIHLHRPASNSTMEIHLVKKSITYQSFKMVIYEDGQRTEADDNQDEDSCQYNGVFANDPEGKAALSTCGHEHSGFSGLLITSEGHFMIEPHAESASDAHFEGTMTITHILVKMNASAYTNAQGESGRYSDAIHLSDEEFEKHAQAERERYAKYHNETEANKESETEEDQEDEKDEVESNLVMSTGSKQTFRDSLVSLAATKKKAKKGKTATTAKPAKSAKSSNGPTVEMAVFCDPPLLDHIKKKYPQDTEKKMREYVMTIVHAMDLLYQHPSLGVVIHFKLVHLELWKTWPKEIKHKNGELIPYLESFCDFAGEQNEGTSMWDHSLALTGWDIRDGAETGVLGVAYAGTMCFKYRSCSLSEGHSFELVFIITHEIGHSVAMDHDGDKKGTSGACSSNTWIMSPTTGPGKVTWSTCSSKNLRDFLQYGTNRPGGRSGMKPSCLTIPSSRADSVDYTSSVLPGQKYDMTQQCSMHVSGGKPSATRNKNMCSMAYCTGGGYDRMAHPALEGTTCATGKVCKGGQCV